MFNQDNFECVHCGECCMCIVNVNQKEIDHIKHLGYSEEHFVEPDHFDKEKKALKLIDGKCVFLRVQSDGSYRCKIYASRPNTCTKYPFVAGIKEIEDCRPTRAFNVAFDEAKELLDKRGFI